ncbi:hypothetical protein [Rudaeicoccus suwonensis]|uniref:Uncharacterized protein n=1 Tax=Rudaeicoccus suwonensis TaxID=657409 RepID=A0A561EA09_9MICO|nr:hypothetical protein [Rudaeicoccus suwonensis]TWE12446.1 hypothetical protein BKA23_1254 [Rudaeicoccus suwonensis]
MPSASAERRGVVLVHGDARTTTSWVRQGLVPSYVVPLAGWTAVVPGGDAQAVAPYDATLTVMANRPVPGRLRNALGFFEIDKRAVVVVHPRGWRALPRWLVWMPGRGVTKVPSLPVARPGDLTTAAGVVPGAAGQVREILADRGAAALDVLSDLMAALALPGGELLFGRLAQQAQDATLVEPDRKAVRRFARVTSEDNEIRTEMEQL